MLLDVRYLPTATYAVGEPFPFENPNPADPQPLLVSTDRSLVLVLYMTEPADVAMVAEKEITVSLAPTEKDLAIVVLAFTSVGVHVTYLFNGALMTDEGYRAFRYSATPVALVTLVDPATNNIVATREVDLPPALVSTLKGQLESNRAEYLGNPKALTERLEYWLKEMDDYELWAFSMQFGKDMVGYAAGPTEDLR